MTEGPGGSARQGQDGVHARLEPGSVIAGYELESPLGQGGMAVVWLARDTQLDRQVALKVLALALTADELYRRRFITESRAASAIDDPHIIPVYQAGEADGVLYIAMRYARGGDVGTLCRKEGALPTARVAAIVSPIASALDAAHEEGLVHRDVKPANMLIDARPRRPDHVYLADFGLSLRSVSSQRLTMAGFVMGTPDYCAPEQINGSRALTGQTDQYALACSTLEMLTGSPPFPREDSQAILYAHLLEPPPMLSTRRAGLPRAADRVLAKAMAKAPQDRYASCLDFADELRSALGLAPYLPVPPGEPSVDDDHQPDADVQSHRGRHRVPSAVLRSTEVPTAAMPADTGTADRPGDAARAGQPGTAGTADGPEGGSSGTPGADPIAAGGQRAPAATVIDRQAASPLAPPGGLRSEIKPDAVVLRWAHPEAAGVVSYKVVRLTTAPDGSQPDFRVLGTTSAAEFEDAGVPGGVLVAHEVTAISGRRTSAVAQTAPALMAREVTGLRAQADASGITLRWSLPVRFGRVVIERSADPRAGLTIAPRRAIADGPSWTDPSPQPGVNFSYHVYAEYRDSQGSLVRTAGARVRAAAEPRRDR